MPAALTYLAIMLVVIIIWFLLLKRLGYEAVLTRFISLLTITGIRGSVGDNINTGRYGSWSRSAGLFYH